MKKRLVVHAIKEIWLYNVCDKTHRGHDIGERARPSFRKLCSIIDCGKKHPKVTCKHCKRMLKKQWLSRLLKSLEKRLADKQT